MADLATLEFMTQTPEERAQAGYGDIDFALGVGVPNWNPVAKVGYDPKAVGNIPMRYGMLGSTASFADRGLQGEDTSSPFMDREVAKRIDRLVGKYTESNPEYLDTPYPVYLNKKLMYLEDPEIFKQYRKSLGLGEKDIPATEEGMRELKRLVLEHEFTHRGNKMLGRGSTSEGSAWETEETGTRATMSNKPNASEFDKAMYEKNLQSYPSYYQPKVTPEMMRIISQERAAKYKAMAEERLKQLKRRYEDL